MHYISDNLLTGALLAFCCTSATAWKFVTNERQFLKPGFKQQFLDLAKVTGHGSVERGIHVSGVTFGNIETDSWAHDWAYPNNASSLLGLDLPPHLLSSLKVRQDGSDIEYACGEASCTNDGFATIEECSWIVRKANDAPRQEAQHHNRSRPATDIPAALISYFAMFALFTPGCNADIFTKVVIFTIWFLPLGAVLAVLPVTHQPNDWMRPFNYVLQIIWLSVAWFIAISDLSVQAMIHNPTRFGGLHQLQCVAVGTHHAALLFLAIGRQYPRGDRSWPYAMIAALWLGLVALYVHLPPLSMPQSFQCIELGN